MAEAAHYKVLVVGAGPAGLAAASCAAESGGSVGIIDDNLAPGGQIYRATAGQPNPHIQSVLLNLQAKEVQIHAGTTVIDAPKPGVVAAYGPSGVMEIRYEKLILTVGARELLLPFPGWTLPNVMGVGGLQALVKAGLDVQGKRIVVAGSGPLLIAVAAYLIEHGARVVKVAEQSDARRLLWLGLSLLSYRSKLGQGISLMAKVAPHFKPSSWVINAEGEDRLQAVRLRGVTGPILCDYLACSFGFVPNLELPMLLGCAIDNDYVKVDELQQTSSPDVFCAGEPTGIGGVELSEAEGRIAGYAAAGDLASAKAHFRDRIRWRGFAQELNYAFWLRSEILSLAKPDTIVCRCEDVRLNQLSQYGSSRAAKLHTRCGMGPCQGRVCGPITEHLLGWDHGSVRPPLVPVPVSCLGVPEAAAGKHTIPDEN